MMIVIIINRYPLNVDIFFIKIFQTFVYLLIDQQYV